MNESTIGELFRRTDPTIGEVIRRIVREEIRIALAERSRPRVTDCRPQQMLADLKAGKNLSYRKLADLLGYHRSTIQHIVVGRNQAGKLLARDIEQLWTEWRAMNGEGTGDSDEGQRAVEMGGTANRARHAQAQDAA